MTPATEVKMARPGRKRLAGRRTRSGRLARTPQAADRGTEQLQAVRAWLAQGGNPDLTAYPLGILLANGEISERQHEAGCRYAWLHAIVFGRTSYAAMAFERVSRGRCDDSDDKWRAVQAARLRAVARKLKAQPAVLRSTVDSIAIYERTPRWLKPVMPRVSDVREAGLLLQALDILAAHFERRLDKAA